MGASNGGLFLPWGYKYMFFFEFLMGIVISDVWNWMKDEYTL